MKWKSTEMSKQTLMGRGKVVKENVQCDTILVKGNVKKIYPSSIRTQKDHRLRY